MRMLLILTKRHTSLSSEVIRSWVRSSHVTRCPMISCDDIRYHLVSNDVTRFHMISHDDIWSHMISPFVKWLALMTSHNFSGLFYNFKSFRDIDIYCHFLSAYVISCHQMSSVYDFYHLMKSFVTALPP